jgi:non-specific serine/threonine protein kinase/serine/threonine-protein kinase
MEPERWQEIERLCYSALHEEKTARAAFLQRACGGDEALRRAVELLLAQHEKDDDFLEVPAMEVAAKALARDQQNDTSGGTAQAPAAETSPDLPSVERISIGPYRLLQKLGEGGMGEVWLAEQSKPVRRLVALKLIKAGMDTREVVARFESERQALALMDHPAIAKVFDAGSTLEGRPYFVMEYVSGIPITAYCDKHRMTTRQRMELFIQVCEGVQHAHQKAIIHRDLKPSNILVSEVDGKPMPRIIDFGLAKATSQRLIDSSVYTRVGTLLGTLEYMSPEQASSDGEDIDTRTDVYSLGVVLYQLLVGALPLDLKKLAYDEILHRLRDKEVTKPSSRIQTLGDSSITAKNRGTDAPSLTRQLRGDPDAVVLKALEKDRKRRYGSPSELAADLGRYLRNEPVSAHAPSAAYRARKYIRRHRLGVAVATGLLAILPTFAVVERVQLQRTRIERDRANRERDRATRITDFMTGMFQVSDPSEQRGNSVTAREILDKASNDIKTGMAKDPDAQAGMMQVIGEVYIGLGLFSHAKDLEQQSLDIRRNLLGSENPDTLVSMNDLAQAVAGEGDRKRAIEMYREEIDIERRVLGPENSQTLNARINLAGVLEYDGHSVEAEKMYRELLPVVRRVVGPENPKTLEAMDLWAIDLSALGRNAEAEKLDREVLEIDRRLLGPEHPDTLMLMSNLAFILFKEARYVEAEKLNRETLGIRRRVLGPEHPETLISMGNLSLCLTQTGRYAEAEKLLREALGIRRRLLQGPEYSSEHWFVVYTMRNLAAVLSREGRYAEAEKLARDAVNISSRVWGSEQEGTAGSVYVLGCIEARKGNRSEALSLLRQAVDHGLSASGDLEMETDPDLKSLHGDPRFIAMVTVAKQHAAANPGSGND